MPGESGFGLFIEGELPARMGLGVLLYKGVGSAIDDGSRDREKSSSEIKVAPPQCAQLAPSCASDGGEPKEATQVRVALRGCFEEGYDLLWGRQVQLVASYRRRACLGGWIVRAPAPLDCLVEEPSDKCVGVLDTLGSERSSALAALPLKFRIEEVEVGCPEVSDPASTKAREDLAIEKSPVLV